MAKSNTASLDAISLIICDAGPLIHLDELGCIALLADFDTVLIPDQVWQEVQHHRPQALSQSASKFQRIFISIDPSATFQKLVHQFTLDLGEQAALSLMATYPTAILLTDDAAARLAAQALHYQAYGTLGSCCGPFVAKKRPRLRLYKSSKHCQLNLPCTFVALFYKASLLRS